MRLILTIAGLCFLTLAGVRGADAQTTTATVVQTCGTPPSTYPAGASLPLTQDTTGTLCAEGGGGSSTITANSTATLGFANQNLVYSDGSKVQALVLGTGIFSGLGTNENGSGAFAGTTSPVFVTPTLGVAAATSLAVGTGSAITSSGPGGNMTGTAYAALPSGGLGNALFGTVTSNVANDIVTMSNTTVGVQDSGTLLSSLAPKASYCALAGAGACNLTGFEDITIAGLAATTALGEGLINSTASTSGATVQVSPALDFQGHAWNTTSVAADNYVDAQISLTPVSGATPSGSMNFGFRTSIGGSGAFTNILTLNSTGESVLSGNGLLVGTETVLAPTYVQTGAFVAFNNASYIGLGSNQDVSLYRGGAAGLLALSDSTTPTALYAYASVDTPTGPTNFQRAIFDAGKKTANTVTIGADNGGTGAAMGLNLTVALTTGGGPTTVMGFSSAGLATLPLITSDAGLTDATMCEDTTAHGVHYGSGTLGICLGTSSIRYKHDVTPLDNGLDTIMALNPKRYYLNADHGDPNKPYYGFIAEDCSKAIPELTGLDDLGRPNTCDYVGIIPILVNAIKQQQAEIESLHRFQ